MRIDLRYGEGSLPLEEDVQTSFASVLPIQFPSVSDLSAEIVRAVSNPKYADSLSSQIGPDSKVAVCLEGPLLPQHAVQMLDSVLSMLVSNGVSSEDVTVLSSLEEDRMKPFLEIWDNSKLDEFKLAKPIADYQSELIPIGNTPTYSVPILVPDVFLKSDFRIGIGVIRPTPFGGATGGRMAISPGLVGEKTRYHNMKLMATKSIGLLNIDAPCAKDMAEAAELAGLNFIVNSVMDYRNNIAEVVAGDFMMAWGDGVTLLRKLTLAKVSRRADIVVVSAGGAGNDSTLFRSLNAIESAIEASRHGGVIVLVAECSADVGSDGLVRGVSDYESEEALVISAETNYEPGMERARLLLRALTSRKVVICSRLRPSLVEERLRCVAVRDPQEGLEVARNWTGSKARISIIPNGGSILPKLPGS